MTTSYLVQCLSVLGWFSSSLLDFLRCLWSSGGLAGGLMSWDALTHVWKLAGYWPGISCLGALAGCLVSSPWGLSTSSRLAGASSQGCLRVQKVAR